MRKNKVNFYILLCPLIFYAGIFLWPNNAAAAALTADNIVRLTNNERTKIGLQELASNALLAQAANDKAEFLMARQIFQHNIGERKFSSWIKAVGYEYSYAGENLALDFITAEGAVKAWLDSPTHRSNLLGKDFTQTGVAVKNGTWGDHEASLVVQIFGQPAAARSQAKRSIPSSLAPAQNWPVRDQVLSQTQLSAPAIITQPTHYAASDLKNYYTDIFWQRIDRSALNFQQFFIAAANLFPTVDPYAKNQLINSLPIWLIALLLLYLYEHFYQVIARNIKPE
jgi:hypothetical protein